MAVSLLFNYNADVWHGDYTSCEKKIDHGTLSHTALIIIVSYILFINCCSLICYYNQNICKRFSVGLR